MCCRAAPFIVREDIVTISESLVRFKINLKQLIVDVSYVANLEKEKVLSIKGA